MEFLHAELLVVLAPALLCVALCLLANHAAIASVMAKHVTLPMRELLTSREHVESLLSLATNLAFVGSAAGVVFGFSESSREAFLLGMVVARLPCSWSAGSAGCLLNSPGTRPPSPIARWRGRCARL